MRQKKPHPEIAPDQKFCTGCETPKLKANEFNKNKSREDGLQDWCKICTRAAVAVSAERKKAREQAAQ